MSRQTLVLDSTQITDFLSCARYWKLRRHERLVTTNKIAPKTAAGSYGHHILELYYKNKFNGMSSMKAMENAKKFQLPADFPLSLDRQKLVLALMEPYWQTYTIADIDIATTKKHRIVLDGSALKDEHFDDPLIEVGFSHELLNTKDYLFVLEGRYDVVGRVAGQKCWLDHKFQDRERDLYGGSIQFRNYCLALDVDMGVVNYIRLHTKVNDNTFERKVVWWNKAQRLQWRNRLIEIYKQIANDMDKGEFPKNEAMCPGKFGYKCEFTDLCEETRLVTIEALKKQYFRQEEEWKPW